MSRAWKRSMILPAKGKSVMRSCLKLFLPGEKITPELEPRIRSAIRRYCQFQIEKITDNLEIETRLGRRTLYYGISILVICLLLSGLGFLISSNATNPYLYALGGFMYNGFMIIGWVSLWTPTSMLVFERWPDWISRNTYEHLRECKLRSYRSLELDRTTGAGNKPTTRRGEYELHNIIDCPSRFPDSACLPGDPEYHFSHSSSRSSGGGGHPRRPGQDWRASFRSHPV